MWQWGEQILGNAHSGVSAGWRGLAMERGQQGSREVRRAETPITRTVLKAGYDTHVPP